MSGGTRAGAMIGGAVTAGALLSVVGAAPAGSEEAAGEGHHVISAAAIARYQSASLSAQETGEAYFAAYLKKEWDTVESLLADHASFRDVTAELLFDSVSHEGKEAVMTIFREGFARITDMRFHETRTLYSGHYALFEGALDWTVVIEDGRAPLSMTMAIMTMLKVGDGLVVEHRDFADYTPFIAAERASRERAEAEEGPP